jgi:aminopeptidase N
MVEKSAFDFHLRHLILAGRVKRLLFIILVSFLFNGCAIFRYHQFGETPDKTGHYPLFSEKDYLIGQLDAYREGYHVTFYDLNLRLDPDRKMLGGEVTIYFRAVKKNKYIRIDLYEDLYINSLKFSGKEMPFKRKDRAVIVSLSDSLIIGNNYTLKVVYEGKPTKAKNPPWKGGMIWKKDKDGNPWVGVTCETEGASIWFPCKDHLSDEPDSVKLHMTVPAGLQVVSNGIMESHTSEPGKEIYTWSTHYPINIYNITFYVGKFVHFSDTLLTGQGILNLDYYVLPENLEKAKEHFRQVKDVINIYSRSFGPYPWIKEGFKLVESPYEGMEHQTAIAYGSGYKNLRWLGGDYVIVHEIAHEWWGNAVSVSDFADIWLQEGFATYSEMVFAESKKGYDSSLFYASNWLASMISNKLPVVGPRDVSFWNTKDNDVYNKGAMILHTIRNVLNDSTLFFSILQTFYREHAASSHVTTADFKEIVERKTGKDWDKFFEAYLYNRDVPVLHWYAGYFNNDQDPGNNIMKNVPFVVAKWTQVPDGFNMPVTLDCVDGKGSATIKVTTKPTLFYLKDMMSCHQLLCNKKLSYFNSATDIGILEEAGITESKNK